MYIDVNTYESAVSFVKRIRATSAAPSDGMEQWLRESDLRVAW